MKRSLFTCLALFICYSSFARSPQVWAKGTYKLYGKVKTVTCYEYADSEFKSKTICTYNIKKQLLTENETGRENLCLKRTYACDRHTYTITTNDITKGTTNILVKRYKHRNLANETYTDYDKNNNLKGYKTVEYRDGREISYSSYNADSALKCHCTYKYQNGDSTFPKATCDPGNDINCALAPVTKYVTWKTRGFDMELPDDCQTEYTKDAADNITEAKQYDKEGKLINHFKYSDFDKTGNWHKKEIAPGHYIRLEIEYY